MEPRNVSPKTPRPPTYCIIQVKMGSDGTVKEHKSECSIRVDLMKPDVNFNQSHIQCPTAEKTYARMLFVITATHGWNLEYMEIIKYYVHEKAGLQFPIDIK